MSVFTFAGLFLLLAALTTKSYAESLLVLGSTTPTQNPLQHVEYFAAQHGNYRAATLVNEPELFTPLHQKPLRLDVHTHWYRIAVHNSTNAASTWYFATGVANPPHLRAFWIAQEPSGQSAPTAFSNSVRVIEPVAAAHYASQTNFSVPLQLQAQETGVLLIEYRSLANFPLTLRVFTPHDYRERSFKYTLLNGISLGVGLVLLLFFVVQYCLYPRPVLGFYCLFILSTLLFMAQVFGYGWRLLFPAMLATSAHITSVTGSMIYIFYFLFCAYFFDAKQGFGRLFYCLLGCSALVAALAVLGLVWPTDFLLSLLVAAALPLPIIAAGTNLQHHQPSVRFFLLGCCAHAGMTYFLLLACLGMQLHVNVFALATAGQFIDVLCFSAAILLLHRNTQKQLDWQLRERQRDMEILNSSEQQAHQLRDQTQRSVLQEAASAHDVLQLTAAMRLQLAVQNPADPVVAQLQRTLARADELLQSRLLVTKTDYRQRQESLSAQVLLQDTFLHHAPIFAAHQLELNLRIQPATVRCLPLAVQRILDNLLNNALRHTSRGRVLLTGRVRKDGYLIQVRDTGSGINADHLQNLLQPFTQVPGADFHSSDSVGLGLFIISHLSASMGYPFSIQSRPGHGTCCSLFIPKETSSNFHVA